MHPVEQDCRCSRGAERPHRILQRLVRRYDGNPIVDNRRLLRSADKFDLRHHARKERGRHLTDHRRAGSEPERRIEAARRMAGRYRIVGQQSRHHQPDEGQCHKRRDDDEWSEVEHAHGPHPQVSRDRHHQQVGRCADRGRHAPISTALLMGISVREAGIPPREASATMIGNSSTSTGVSLTIMLITMASTRVVRKPTPRLKRHNLVRRRAAGSSAPVATKPRPMTISAQIVMSA